MREGYRGAAYGKLSAMTTMLRRVALVVVLAASPSPSLAQGVGEVGTRAAGMGGAFVAVADDASAVYWNPAGLAFGSYVTLVGDRLAMRAGASGQARSSLFLGLGLPPLGVSYYRLRGVAVTAPGPTAGPLQDRNDAGTGDLRLDSLVTHNAGVTLVQSVVAGVAIGSTLMVAALLEFARVPVPSSHRQVNERWIGAYRSWVYGGGFGLQLGTGFLTHVVTWAVPAVFLAELLLANPGTGALVGAAFGGGRWLLLGAAGWIDRPSRLSRFTATLARWAAPASWAVPVVLLGLGSTVMLLGWGGATQ